MMGKCRSLFIYLSLLSLLIVLPTNVFSSEQVTLQLLWKNQFQFAGYYAAKELGFYKEAGLDVTIREYDLGIDVTGDVVAGKADFGVGRSSIILEHMEGKPLSLLSAIFQNSPFMLLTKKRDDLKDITDLKGKRIMVTADAVGMASLTAMLTGNGIRQGDYTSQKHSFSVDDLINGNTDAIAAYSSNETYQMQMRGVGYTIFAPKDHGFDFYSDILFTSQRLLKENPELVERFRRATIRGWEYAFANIDEVVDIILKKYNTQNRDADALRFEAKTLKQLAYVGETPLGFISRDRLERIGQVYQLLGFTHKPLKTDGLIYKPSAHDGLLLTPEEQAWLADHPKILVGGLKDWAPLDFVDETGKYIGIANDYLNIIGNKLGIEIEIITGPSWGEFLTMIRRKEIDLLPAIYHSKEREVFLRFTEPYLKLTEFIFSRTDDERISSFTDLKDKTIVVGKGYTIEKFLRSNYPGYDLITAPNIQGALKKLVTGEADAFIGEIISTSYNIKELSLVGIRPVAPVPFEQPKVHMAVRKDWPILRQLIDKAFESIQISERNAIKNRWISFTEKRIEKKRSKLSLTAEEKAWLAQHPKIRVHNETASPPFNFAEHGRPKGFSIDYMRLLAEKVGIDVEFITGPSWDEFMGMMKTGDLDVMLNIAKTPERQEYLSYTPSYVTLTQTLFTRKDFPLVLSIEDLYGKRIAVPKGFYIAEMLKAYPQVEVVEVRDIIEAMTAVSVGKADALYDLMPVINYLANKHQITNLKVGGDLGIEAGRPMPLHLAVPKKDRMLAGILAKGMEQISDEEFQALSDKWIGRIQPSEKLLSLTREQRAWLDSHTEIHIGVMDAWPPMNFLDPSGRPVGIGADYIQALNRRLQHVLKIVPGPFKRNLEQVKNRELDALMDVTPTTDREAFLNFTRIYLSIPHVIVAPRSGPYHASETDLNGKRLALEKGFYNVTYFRENHPDVNIREYPDTSSAIGAVVRGEADAYAGNLAVAGWIMEQEFISGLQIQGRLNYPGSVLTMGVRKDWPELAAILDKALADIAMGEIQDIRRRWLGLAAKPEEKPQIPLTDEEVSWLKANPIIRVHNELDWPPFNFFEYGEPKGLSIDYMNLLAERLGIKVDYVSGPTWSDFLGMIQLKQLDVMLNIVKTEDRLNYLLYTDPYVRNPNVIVSAKKSPYNSIESLSGRTVAFPKGFFYEEVLKKSFPEIKRLPVKDTLACLMAVGFGKADAAVGEEAVVRSLMTRNMLLGLHVSGEVEIGNPDLPNLRIGVRDDWPLLQSALVKAMASVSSQEMNDIRQRWLIKAEDRVPKISLTDDERDWVQTHPRIKVNGGNLPPFIIRTKEGQPHGISTELLKMAADQVGLKIEFIDGPWPEMMEMLKKKELDLIQCVSKTPDREAYIHFSDPYITMTDAIYVPKQDRTVRSILDLETQSLAVIRGTKLEGVLAERYPDIRLVPVNSALEGLRRTIDGDASAYIGSLISSQYEIKKRLIGELRIAAYFDEAPHDLRLGARADAKILADIMQKGLDSISEDRKREIIATYVNLSSSGLAEVADGRETALPGDFRSLLLYGTIVFLGVCLLALVLIKILQRENIAVSFGSRWFRGLVVAGLTVFVILVGLAGWLVLERNREMTLQGVDHQLRGILFVSGERLGLWLAERKSYFKRLGRDPELVKITRRLLTVPPEKRALLESAALREMRFFFRHTEDIFPNIGFFIIDPNHVSIGSMRDANLGTRNLISEQHPDLIRRAFKREVGFVPPITSDVTLKASNLPNGGKNPPTSFFIGPVQDADGLVLAVMTLRVDPVADMSQGMKLFDKYRSVDVYAFDQQGRMMTSSRFDEQLRNIGLLDENQGSALNLEIRDPGVNLVKGQHSNLNRSDQPLTYMVTRAIALQKQMQTAGVKHGHSNIETDMAGYRDYRGVPVYGAWLWNRDLDTGLAAEIDVEEALGAYNQTRMTVFGILGFTLFLSVGAILFVLIVGERTSRALMRARDNLEEKVEGRTAELMDQQKLLVSSEERTRLLLDSVGEGIFGVDLNGKVTFINSAAIQLLGYETDELLGQEVHLKIHHTRVDGSPYPVEACPMARAYTHGSTEKIDDEMLWRKDGSGISVEYTATPIIRENDITGAVIAFRDITERKQADERFRVLFEQSSDAHVLFDDEGIIDCNNAAIAMMGAIDKADLMSRHPAEFSPERQPDGRLSAEKSEEMDAIAREKGHHRFDWIHRKVTGEEFPVEVSLTPVTLAMKIVLLVVWHDLTERKRMEEAMAAERERLQRILDTSPVAVGISIAGVMQYANDYLSESFGIRKGDRPALAMVNPEKRYFIVEELERIGSVAHYELQVYDAKREIRDVIGNYIHIDYEGKPAVLGWWIDVTDIKETAKKLEIKLDELTRFRRLAVGREKKMVELKQEINGLLKECGVPGKYKIH